MRGYVGWFVLAFGLLIAELVTGTFYLLVTALALAGAGVAHLLGAPGGMEAVNLKVAEKYVEAFAGLAKTNNTLIVPANLADLGGLIATAMTVVKSHSAQVAVK